jgi:hypothetical protein
LRLCLPAVRLRELRGAAGARQVGRRMTGRRIYRPGTGTSSAEQMAAHLRGTLAVKPRKVTGELLEMAAVQGLAIVETNPGYAIVDAFTGAVEALRGRTLAGIDPEEVGRFLRADADYVCPDAHRDRRLADLSDRELLELAGDGARLEDVEHDHRVDHRAADRDRVADHDLDVDRSPWRLCDPDCELEPGLFRGGPLDGQRRNVPAHGPAIVRYRSGGAVYYYVHRRGTRRTYSYAGSWTR